MSRITAGVDIDRVKDEEADRFTQTALEDIVATINGGLDFTTNFNCKILSVVFAAANTPQTIPHGLGRVPTGYIISSLSAATIVYSSGTPSTTSNIYLSATVAATVGLIVF